MFSNFRPLFFWAIVCTCFFCPFRAKKMGTTASINLSFVGSYGRIRNKTAGVTLLSNVYDFTTSPLQHIICPHSFAFRHRSNRCGANDLAVATNDGTSSRRRTHWRTSWLELELVPQPNSRTLPTNTHRRMAHADRKNPQHHVR